MLVETHEPVFYGSAPPPKLDCFQYRRSLTVKLYHALLSCLAISAMPTIPVLGDSDMARSTRTRTTSRMLSLLSSIFRMSWRALATTFRPSTVPRRL